MLTVSGCLPPSPSSRMTWRTPGQWGNACRKSGMRSADTATARSPASLISAAKDVGVKRGFSVWQTAPIPITA